MSTQLPDNTPAVSESSPALQDSSARPSPLQRFSERRVAFFAKREGLFLWLLGIPLLLATAYMTLHYLNWTAGQGGILDSILMRDWRP